MSALSLDYGSLVASLDQTPPPDVIGAILAGAAADRYEVSLSGACALLEFEQSGARYWFDFASSEDLPHEDRTVAAWALTPSVVHRRDKSYQRGFPMVADERSPVDRGHLIPHMSGGEFGPNIFRQDRSLNQGRSEQGKRYRALERAAATVPGALYFGHLLYADYTAYPRYIEIAVLLPGGTPQVERFDNRPGAPPGPPRQRPCRRRRI